MTLLKNKPYAAVVALCSISLAFAGWRLASDAPKVLDLAFFLFFAMALFVAIAIDLCEQILRKIDGASAAATAAVKKEAVVVSLPHEQPRQRTHYEEMELAAAAAFANFNPALDHDLGKRLRKQLGDMMTNPHTGAQRDSRDVASDPQATLCVKPGEPVKTAPIALPVIDPGPDSLEREIQAKASAAPRVTKADLKANIVHTEIVEHVSHSGQVLRWAVLTTRSGFAVCGRPSASVSPENDDPDLGKRVAIDNAENELWPLMGYELRGKLASRCGAQCAGAKQAEAAHAGLKQT